MKEEKRRKKKKSGKGRGERKRKVRREEEREEKQKKKRKKEKKPSGIFFLLNTEFIFQVREGRFANISRCLSERNASVLVASELDKTSVECRTLLSNFIFKFHFSLRNALMEKRKQCVEKVLYSPL